MDSKRSFVIALASSWIAFCNTGIYRSSSVLYVEMIQVMALTRESASWPFSLFGAISSFTGILPGLLSNHFSVYQFVITGAALSTLGVLGCFFADDAVWITLSFGIVAGFGSGLIMTLLPVVINENFKNNRATANGIFLSGSTVSLLVLPSITEWLVHLYALKGTFLLLSGLVLNVLVGAMFLKQPRKKSISLLTSTEPENKNHEPEVKTSARYSNKETAEPNGENSLTIAKNFNLGLLKSLEVGRIKPEEIYYAQETKSELSLKDTTLSLFQDDQVTRNQTVMNRLNYSHPEVRCYKADEDSEEMYIQLKETSKTKNCNRFPIKTFKKTMNTCGRTMMDPMFILITFCSVTTRTIIVTVSLILVDYVMDKGETEIEGVILVSVIAIPELVGRLGSGWISDHKFLRRKHVFLISEAFSGICLLLLTIVNSSFLIFTLCALFALANGGAFILVNVFYLEYLGLDRLPVALGLKNLFTGLASLTRPWFIGFFRDQICSYDKLFQALGVISIMAGVVWFLEPLLLQNREKYKPNLEQK